MTELNEVFLGKGLLATIRGQVCLAKGFLGN